MQNEPFSRTESSHAPQEGRLYYLDWLRVFAILVVFFHHCAKPFDYHTFTIYNAVRSLPLSLFREFDFLWMMPLFFIISGASVYYSLGSRKAAGFIKERTLRILIPLVFVGTFVINAPQVYLERLLKGETVSSFIQWYPQFFDGLYLVSGGNFAPLGIGTHLWYLMYLFIFSLVLLPLFIPYGKTRESVIARLSRLFEKPWALFLLFVPISATAAGAEMMGLGITRHAGGWDPITFLVFFICGYLIFSNPRIRENIQKYGTICLIMAVILTTLYLD
ncbi:MAG TPA: acyltransferase family protein, partial [Syntrophales bacterium]|nr:acyltransferase family protein [Syntrophales bacterium]